MVRRQFFCSILSVPPDLKACTRNPFGVPKVYQPWRPVGKLLTYPRSGFYLTRLEVTGRNNKKQKDSSSLVAFGFRWT